MHGHWRNAQPELAALHRAYHFTNTTELLKALEDEQRGANYIRAYGQSSDNRRGKTSYMALAEIHEHDTDPMSSDDEDPDALMMCYNCLVEEECAHEHCLCSLVDSDHYVSNDEFADHIDRSMRPFLPILQLLCSLLTVRRCL